MGNDHRSFIDYIDRTRAYYLAKGFNNPYRWAQFDDVPFARPTKPLARSRIAIVTTAAPYQPDKGDQGPYASQNASVGFRRAYAAPIAPPPDLRISHLTYDRANTCADDMDAYFPLSRLQECVAEGRIGSLAERFYGVPTSFSQASTIERDAPDVLRLCREDGVDAAILVPI